MSEKRTINRRKFLGAAAGTVAGVLTLGGYVPASARNQKNEEKAGGLIIRTLGRTGYKIPVVGMGVMNADNPELVHRAYELGIRHLTLPTATAWTK